MYPRIRWLDQTARLLSPQFKLCQTPGGFPLPTRAGWLTRLYSTGGNRKPTHSQLQEAKGAGARFTEKAENIGKKKNSVRRVVTAPTGLASETIHAPSAGTLPTFPGDVYHRTPQSTVPFALVNEELFPKCIAVTTAERYNFQSLLPRLQCRFTMTPITQDVYHLCSPSITPETHETSDHAIKQESSSPIRRGRMVFDGPEGNTLGGGTPTDRTESDPAVETPHGSPKGEVPVSPDHPYTLRNLSGPRYNDKHGSTSHSLFPETVPPIIPPEGEIFVFQSGAYVTWGLGTHEVERFLREVIEATPGAEIGKYDEVEVEDAPFYILGDGSVKSPPWNANDVGSGIHSQLNGSVQQTGMAGDIIVIGPTPDPLLSKLAFSHGVARSAKLAVLEALLDQHLQNASKVPRILQRGQKIPWSRSQVLQQLGELLHFRGMLNLHSESFLDTPDYYWTKPQLEAYYDDISRNLDIVSRTRILNTKLDYANELAAVLREQLSETHSLNLEWCIILLIAVEVCFELFHYWERYQPPSESTKRSAASLQPTSE